MSGLQKRLRQSYELVRQTLDAFARHRGGLLAAALAFHTLLSLAPLVIVAVATAGIVLGQGAAHAEMTRVLYDALGAEGAAAIDSWVHEASRGGEVAGAVGIGLMLLAASKLGTRLREVLNQIWDVDPDALIPRVRDYLRRRLLAFGLVTLAGPTLLVVFVTRTVLSGLHGAPFGATAAMGALLQLAQLALSLAITAAMFAVIFRLVPDTHVSWRIAWLGSVLTSVLFNAGNALVALYLGKASTSAAYGAAGSVLVVLLWLYFSAHLFLMGAEFTQVYASATGARPASGRG
jgi:membrane protein